METTLKKTNYRLQHNLIKLVQDNRITFFSDPGHGWLRIPIRLFNELQISGVTGYSYIDPEFIYLEEDCDIMRFFIAINFQFPDDKPLMEIFWAYCENSYKEDSPVRNMKGFDIITYQIYRERLKVN